MNRAQSQSWNRTRDTISEEKEQWGVCEVPVWEDSL